MNEIHCNQLFLVKKQWTTKMINLSMMNEWWSIGSLNTFFFLLLFLRSWCLVIIIIIIIIFLSHQFFWSIDSIESIDVFSVVVVEMIIIYLFEFTHTHTPNSICRLQCPTFGEKWTHNIHTRTAQSTKKFSYGQIIIIMINV